MGGEENAKNVENAEAKAEPTVESLVYELSEEKKESLKNKEFAQRVEFENKAGKEREERLKEVLVSNMSQKDELETRQKKLEEELFEAKKRIATESFRQRFMKLDISESESRRLAEAVYLGDTEQMVDVLEKELKRIRDCFYQEAQQEFLLSRGEIRAGHGDVNKKSLAMDMAQQYMADRKNTVDMKMLENFM